MFSALAYNHGDLQDKLNLYIALAPIAEMNHMTNSLMTTGASLWKLMLGSLKNYGLYEVGEPTEDREMDKFCKNFLFKAVCSAIANTMNAPASEWNDPERCAVQNTRPQSRASTKEIIHFAQVVNVDHFQQYNYGSDSANRSAYGTTSIPKIPIENIKKVPIAYFVGLHDDLADPTDAQASYN